MKTTKVNKNFLYILTSLIFFLFFNSCKTDLDITIEGQEVAVIYGVLDQTEQFHRIRINKSFIGNEDANDLAQVQSNIEYGDVLDVSIQEIVNGQVINTFILDRTLDTTKVSGVFAAPNQHIYTFSATLNPDAIYKLKVVDTEKDKEYTAETKIVNNFIINNPTATPQSTIVFGNQVTGITNFNLRWTSPVNGIRTDIEMVFRYREYNTLTGDTTWGELVTNLNDNVSRDDNGGELMQRLFNGPAFAERLNSELGTPPSPEIERWVHGFDFFFAVASLELNTFINVNNGQTPSFQETPAFTNISNGRGIFTSRINQAILNKGINQSTAKQLKDSDVTQFVGFTRFYNALNGQYDIIN